MAEEEPNSKSAIEASLHDASLAQARDGDAELVLDDGSEMAVHAALLELGSCVLKDAVHLARAAERGKLRIPLPSTSAAEARALLLVLYSKRRESCVLALSLEQLRLQSNICHRFVFEDLMALVDEALARHSREFCPGNVRPQLQPEQYLRPDNVAELYWDARSKGLDSFQKACAAFIGAHIHQVAEAAPTDAMGPILSEAAACTANRGQSKSIESDLESFQQQWPGPCGYCCRNHCSSRGLLSGIIQRLQKL